MLSAEGDSEIDLIYVLGVGGLSCPTSCDPDNLPKEQSQPGG